jgi:pimeloyl-ACP methyl ester carboxylesterase
VTSDAVREWEAAGRRVDAAGNQVWMVELPPLGRETRDPAFVLHGFPTCSYDWRHVLPTLRDGRRVVLFDLPGFGLSDKPNVRYSIRGYADAAEAVARAARLERVLLVTHDLGDSVGGELLARDLEGSLDFVVAQRVITNGSIYMDLVQLTAGQEMLLAADDEPIDLAALGLDPERGFKDGLAGTFAVPATDEELAAQWELASRADGHQMLTRTIRYIEDRRSEERRYTGAIETHPSPLGIVWGELDPVAVLPMAHRLHEVRPDSTLTTLPGVGHYPMVEAPDRFAAATAAAIRDGSRG